MQEYKTTQAHRENAAAYQRNNRAKVNSDRRACYTLNKDKISAQRKARRDAQPKPPPKQRGSILGRTRGTYRKSEKQRLKEAAKSNYNKTQNEKPSKDSPTMLYNDDNDTDSAEDSLPHKTDKQNDRAETAVDTGSTGSPGQ